MKTKLILGFVLISFVALAGCNEEVKEDKFYDLSFSDGSCTSDLDCSYSGEGCGGGHGYCTSNPDKYKDMASTCDVVAHHPINNGYKCTCAEALNRCAWEK